MTLLETFTHDIRLPGDLQLNAGRKIRINFPKAKAPATLSQADLTDELISGLFIITSCSHSIEGGKYFCDLRIKRDSNMVLIPDNEPRNKEIVKQIEKFIESDYSVVLWPEEVKEKDINEMILSGKTKQDIQELISKNTFSGIRAKTQFIYWKKVNINEKTNISRSPN